MSALYIILLIGIVLVSLFLLLLVLMQRPKQEGLGATFGVDATNQMFGSRTTDVLQKGTTFMSVIFFLLALSLGLLNAHETKQAARLGADLANLPRPEAPVPAATDAPPADVAPADVAPADVAPGDPAPTEGDTPADGESEAGEETPAVPPAEGETPADVPVEAPEASDDAAPATPEDEGETPAVPELSTPPTTTPN